MVKLMLKSTPVLVHYDPSQLLLLTVDLSSFGLVCVLSHVMKDGSHRPITLKSQKLSPKERNYSIKTRKRRQDCTGSKSSTSTSLAGLTRFILTTSL